MDGICVLTKGYWAYHVQKLILTLIKLKVKGLKFDIEEYFLGENKMVYLVYGQHSIS